jgi:hypothetical protein
MVTTDIENYLDNIYQKNNDQRLVDPNVCEQITSSLIEASKITYLPIPDLLSALDFKPNDQTIEALESFLAELRSIFWLRNFGFKNIVPIQATIKPQPDFTADYLGQHYAIEVFCLTETHEQQRDSSLGVYVNFDPEFKGSKFGRDFISKARQKKVQLDSHNAKNKILLCVLNSQPIIRLNTADEINAHAKFLYDELNWGPNYYVGILTGSVGSDVIYPILAS